MQNIEECYQVADLNALASVKCRAFRFFPNDKVYIQADANLLVRKVNLSGNIVDIYFIPALINGVGVNVPINSLIRTPLPESKTEALLMEASPLNERLIRSTNAKEALKVLLGKSFQVVSFIEEPTTDGRPIRYPVFCEDDLAA